MEYGLSTPRDLPRLEELQLRCFGEEEAVYHRLFLTRRYRPEHCLVARDPATGEAAGAAFLLPLTLSRGEERIPAAYVYALGVHPDWRRRGIGRGLMDYLWEVLEARGVPLAVLVPAEESLFDYYAGLGYQPFGELARGELASPVKAAPLPELRPADGAGYLAARERLLADLPHLAWDREALEYQKAFSQVTPGGLFLLEGGRGCAAAEVYDSRLWLKELLGPPEELPRYAAALAEAFPGWPLEVRTRPDQADALGLPRVPFAVARWGRGAEPSRGYFALALD